MHLCKPSFLLRFFIVKLVRKSFLLRFVGTFSQSKCRYCQVKGLKSTLFVLQPTPNPLLCVFPSSLPVYLCVFETGRAAKFVVQYFTKCSLCFILSSRLTDSCWVDQSLFQLTKNLSLDQPHQLANNSTTLDVENTKPSILYYLSDKGEVKIQAPLHDGHDQHYNVSMFPSFGALNASLKKLVFRQVLKPPPLKSSGLHFLVLQDRPNRRVFICSKICSKKFLNKKKGIKWHMPDKKVQQ